MAGHIRKALRCLGPCRDDNVGQLENRHRPLAGLILCSIADSAKLSKVRGRSPPTPHRIGRGVGCRYGCHLAYGRMRAEETMNPKCGVSLGASVLITNMTSLLYPECADSTSWWSDLPKLPFD
ncbi:hypothetical protein NEUTE2DRAFT_123079 [Neurospora tetrasperma FGSC 2509]|nr:hypothetical protein NEUTE2DRAFT_123079 [Neurospora tetrasperma FGSC 2509]